MSGRIKSITLQVGDRLQDFEISHAERILRMPNNGGWRLPEDSNYQLDEHGINIRRNKEEDTESK